MTSKGKSAYVVGSYRHGTARGTVFAINTESDVVPPSVSAPEAPWA
ncbi:MULTISPECIES: hypothetical protein [unclassified Streptomyces]|nr:MULTISPECIES: hypothetical protein [unclassified Streptomyces]